MEYGLVTETRVASPLMVTAPLLDLQPFVVDTTATPAALPSVATHVIAFP